MNGAAATDSTSSTPLVPSRKKNSVLASRWRAASSSWSYQKRMNAPSMPQRKNSLTVASMLPSSVSTP